MKNIVLILLTILSISCQSQQKSDMSEDKIKFYPEDLVSIKSIPKSEDINSIELKKGMPSVSTLLSKSLFFNALDNNNTRILNLANKLDAKLLGDWHYSPWYTIEFTTAKGNYNVKLFLGGLGFMTLPNGKRGAVLFDLSNFKKEEDKRLLSYYKKIKKMAINMRTNDYLEELGVRIGQVYYKINADAIIVENHYPHPSKEFSENLALHQYVIKQSNSKVSFWSGGIQVLETDSTYSKMAANFIAVVEHSMTMIQQGKYSSTMRLMKGNFLVFPDGLKIKSTYFSHKKTFENQRSPKIAHLELSDKHSDEKWFMIEKNENEDEQGKSITSYESKKWKNYNIELTGLSYNNYIDIIVTKKSDKNLAKNFKDITNELSIDEFEKIKNFILKNKGRQTYRNYDNNNPHFAFIDFDIYLGADIGQKNINNDPEISDFNELIINHIILGALTKYYQLVIVRKGDINKDKANILEDMKEDKVYLVDLDKIGLDKLQKQILPFFKTIRERIASSK